jgi:hypothetical protein
MSNERESQSRRHFLKVATTTVVAATVISGLPRQASATDLPHLSESDPAAKALKYVEDASRATDALHKTGAMCAHCQFFSGSPDGYGPCQLFPGKAVSAKGWCLSYSAKRT